MPIIAVPLSMASPIGNPITLPVFLLVLPRNQLFNPLTLMWPGIREVVSRSMEPSAVKKW